MMRVLTFLILASLLSSFSLEARQKYAGSLSFGVTDKRKVITSSIDKNLLLRVVKENSVSQQDIGWSVEVVRTPYRRNSLNLLYERKVSGEHPSQVFAWHVAEKTFPNERALEVRGYPIKVRIELIEPVVVGEGADRRFVSGKIKISWERK